MQAQAPDSTPVPLPEIRDIAPVVDVFPWPWWVGALVIAGACVVLGLLVWLVVNALRRQPAPPPPSPRAVAIRDLERLRGQMAAMDAHAFSIAVSDVLRTFIGAHFGLKATKQTSPEFLASIANATQFSEEDRVLLAQFLEKCDLIKFARVDAGREEMNELLSSAIGFVQGGRA